MTATLTTRLAMPGVPAHSAAITVPQSVVGRWRKSFRAMREGGVDGAQHSLGWHVYSKRWVPGAYEFGIRWNAGLIRKNGTGFVGRVFFDSLSLEVGGDENLILVPDPRANAFYDAATGAYFVAHGGGHMVPARGLIELRILAVPKTWTPAMIANLRAMSLGFRAVRIPPAGTKPWGPALERMPNVNRSWYASLFGQGVAQARALIGSGAIGDVRLGPSGTWAQLNLQSGALGPYFPDGYTVAGAPAGYEIELGVGWQQVPESLELSSIAHMASMSRNPVAWCDLDTGEQLGCHDWQSSESGRPVTSPVGLVMPAFLNAARTDYPNFNAGSCAYRGALEAYAIEDSEHSVRAADDAKNLAFSAGDAMALDDLAMLFEHHRAMVFNDRSDALPSLSAQHNAGWTKGFDGLPLGPNSPQGSVSWIGYQSLTRDLVQLVANPHHGSARELRQWGWTLDLGWCRQDRAFCGKMAQTHLLARDSCGVAFREYHVPYIPQGIQGAQMFHEMIDKAALLRACRMIGDPILTDNVLDVVRLWATKVLLNPTCRDAKWVYRQRADGSEIDPITAADHGPEFMSEHILAVLGLAALCELDAGDTASAMFFLNAGLGVDVPHATLSQRLAWIKAKTADLSQYASYQAAIEASMPNLGS